MALLNSDKGMMYVTSIVHFLPFNENEEHRNHENVFDILQNRQYLLIAKDASTALYKNVHVDL